MAGSQSACVVAMICFEMLVSGNSAGLMVVSEQVFSI
jgi:hypothetical protein